MTNPRRSGYLVYQGYRDTQVPLNEEPWRIGVTKGNAYNGEIQILEDLPRLNGAFNWGYDGGGPARAAEAMLADALGVRILDLPHDMVRALALDYLESARREWRLPVRMVRRWVRGWCADNERRVPPGAENDTAREVWDEE